MESSGATEPQDNFSFITNKDTRHLRWATTFAALIAFCKRRDELIPSDLLAGIYVANFEKLSIFLSHPEVFDDFVAEHCDWREPRWSTWQRWHDEAREDGRRFRLPFTLFYRGKKLGKRRLSGTMFKQSADWKRLFETGEKLTPHKVSWRNRVLPLLTIEIMLLSFIRTEGIPLGRLLQETGLLVDRLEEAAMRPIENPEKLRF